MSGSYATAPVGVLIMAHGTPRDRGEIEPFYTRIRRGRPPSAEQLAELERRYADIGGLSPLTEVTLAQVEGVRAALERREPGRYVVAYGAKHADPLIEAAAATLTGHAVRRVVGLVLTPHGSSRGSEEYLARAQVALGEECRFVAVPPWYSEPDLVALLAGRVSDALATASAGDDPRRYPVIFTAHSLPEQAAGGDGDGARSYPAQLAESARLVAAAAGVDRWQVAWQSAGRTPEPWLGPDVRDMVRRLAESGGANGAHGVVVCPIGFVADHLEVLYDLDIELADVGAQVGLSYARTASLNDDPRFVEVLADIAAAAAHGG